MKPMKGRGMPPPPPPRVQRKGPQAINSDELKNLQQVVREEDKIQAIVNMQIGETSEQQNQNKQSKNEGKQNAQQQQSPKNQRKQQQTQIHHKVPQNSLNYPEPSQQTQTQQQQFPSNTVQIIQQKQQPSQTNRRIIPNVPKKINPPVARPGVPVNRRAIPKPPQPVIKKVEQNAGFNPNQQAGQQLQNKNNYLNNNTNDETILNKIRTPRQQRQQQEQIKVNGNQKVEPIQESQKSRPTIQTPSKKSSRPAPPPPMAKNIKRFQTEKALQEDDQSSFVPQTPINQHSQVPTVEPESGRVISQKLPKMNKSPHSEYPLELLRAPSSKYTEMKKKLKDFSMRKQQLIQSSQSESEIQSQTHSQMNQKVNKNKQVHVPYSVKQERNAKDQEEAEVHNGANGDKVQKQIQNGIQSFNINELRGEQLQINQNVNNDVTDVEVFPPLIQAPHKQTKRIQESNLQATQQIKQQQIKPFQVQKQQQKVKTKLTFWKNQQSKISNQISSLLTDFLNKQQLYLQNAHELTQLCQKNRQQQQRKTSQISQLLNKLLLQNIRIRTILQN